MAPTIASRSAIFRLMNAAQHGACPCHGHRGGGRHHLNPLSQLRKLATPTDTLPQKDYAFEIAASNLRFGEGVTAEVAMDLANMNARKARMIVAVFTDKNLAKLHPMKTVVHALETQGDVPYEIYDDVSVEPTEASWRHAIEWGRKGDFSHFLAIGGGSVIDTAKAVNLFTVYQDADLMDFINAPIGKGLTITKTLRPLIAVPTTAGTGSETTGAAIVDITSRSFKTGIASRALRPTLGIVDTLNTDSCPTQVHISSGLDVLFHAFESYTAIPYYERMPKPKNPSQRPAYQGSNDVSDIFSMWALQQAIKYLPRIAKNHDDKEAKKHMLLASTFAGIGFGNAGVHLCHGMSYPISGLNKTGPKYHHPEYLTPNPIIPHGISVALTGPAVFQFTAPSSPARHREALALFNNTTPSDSSISRLPDDSIGSALFDAIAKFLDGLGLPRGLTAVGYTKHDLERLVDGTIPQRRVLDLAPGIGDVAGEDGREHLRSILEEGKVEDPCGEGDLSLSPPEFPSSMHFLKFCIALLSLGSMCIAIPTWDMFTSRSKVGDLVPGTSIIHAYGPNTVRSSKAKFLRSNNLPGLESNITVAEWVYGDLGPPSKFFVSNGELYQITNSTTILYTNLINATDAMAHRTPELSKDSVRSMFRMSLSTKKEIGLLGGSWDWVATTLQYRLGSKSNNGLFYKCTETNGDTGVYFPLDIGPTPNGCEVLTLISYTAEGDRRR